MSFLSNLFSWLHPLNKECENFLPILEIKEPYRKTSSGTCFNPGYCKYVDIGINVNMDDETEDEQLITSFVLPIDQKKKRIIPEILEPLNKTNITKQKTEVNNL